MPVRSRLLTAWAGATVTGGSTVFTCPLGRTAVVKTWFIKNQSGVAALCRISLRTGGVTYTMHEVTIPQDGTSGRDGMYLVLAAGDQLRLRVDAGTNAGTIIVSGSLLEGDPT